MWQRGQNQIFHPGCFSPEKACCGFFNRVEKCTFENRKVGVSRYLPVFHGGSAGKPGILAVMDLLWLTGAQWLVVTEGACCKDTRAGVDVEVATS
jgi:hypothetical protein